MPRYPPRPGPCRGLADSVAPSYGLSPSGLKPRGKLSKIYVVRCYVYDPSRRLCLTPTSQRCLLGKELPMKRPLSRLGVGLALWVGAAAATGCTPSNKVKPGQPVMLSFGVVDPTGAPVELETEAGPTLVPPLSTF